MHQLFSLALGQNDISSLRSKRFREVFSSRKFGCTGNGARANKRCEGEGRRGEEKACPQAPRFCKTAFVHERRAVISALTVTVTL